MAVMQTAPLAFVAGAMDRPQLSLRAQPTLQAPVAEVGSISQGVVAAAAAVGAFATTVAAKKSKRATRVARRSSHGEDLAVAHDSFVVLGLAHCFKRGETGNKLQDVYVLEPVSASTVEVVNNGAETSYESFVGTTVQEILSEDVSKVPAELLGGHDADEVMFAEDLEFRTGCAARTWMRDHAQEVVMKLVPTGEVQSDFNTSTRNKRILDFVNEVKDSDNIKQDLSIDVYGRSEEDAEDDGNEDIEALYNA
mmetsp:Transcript_24120/g.55701  ORF Transcript_24120/g.55701 Transcript_24120/m.55701 type:complete len:252 (+) Transcript_24120:90-845(+)